MPFSELWALLVLATAMSFTPGPNTTLSTALAANFGLRRALPFVCAVPVGWGLLLGLCSVGLGALILAVPALAWGIKAVGVGYLWWLAWKLARTRQLGQASDESLNVGFAQGVLLQFLNIKAWMLALSVTAGWIAGQPDALGRYGLALPLMLFFAFSSNFSYALIGSLLRRWLAQGQRLLYFNRLMALALVGTALWILQSL